MFENEKQTTKKPNMFYKGEAYRTPILMGDVIKLDNQPVKLYIKKVDYDNKTYEAVYRHDYSTTVSLDYKKDRSRVKFVRRAPYFGNVDEDTITHLKMLKKTIIANDCFNFYRRDPKKLIKYVHDKFKMDIIVEPKILDGEDKPTIFLKRVDQQ